ncbi:MAG: thiopurine S-methyltransferase [Gammaproteobacteria bacterium]|nr:thiopurine S-methyltransferase [Gammaproteobacteria bacterium]
MASASDKNEHLSPAYWIQLWLAGETGWHHDRINEHLLSHWSSLGVAPGSKVFVPLCGKSRDMVWLVEHGYSVVGVEISPKAVQEFFFEQQLTPVVSTQGEFESYRAPGFHLLCGDIFKLTSGDLDGISAVYDRASLVALNRPQRQRYARLLVEISPPATTMLLVSMDYPETEMQGPPHSVPEAEVSELFADSFSIIKLHTLELLKDSDRYSDRGLSRMSEQIFRLDRG